METKQELIDNVKEWLKIDNDIVKLKTEIKIKNDKKKNITESLVNVMKKNDIDCFDITGGAIIYKKNTIKKPINAKTLLASLQNYYKDKPEVVQDLSKFILDNREEQVKETIMRKEYK